MSTKNGGVPICPALESEEQQRKATKALRDRDEADYQAYMLLKELLGKVGYEPIKRLLARLGDKEEAENWQERVVEMMEKRSDANDRFIDAMAGR